MFAGETTVVPSVSVSKVNARREQLLSLQRGLPPAHAVPHAVPSHVAISRSVGAVHIAQVGPQLDAWSCTVHEPGGESMRASRAGGASVCVWVTEPHPTTITSPSKNLIGSAYRISPGAAQGGEAVWFYLALQEVPPANVSDVSRKSVPSMFSGRSSDGAIGWASSRVTVSR